MDNNTNKPAPSATEVSFAAEREEIKSRKFKYGTMAAAISVIFVVAVVVVNVFVGYMTDRFVLEFDMTAEKLFDISDDTKEVIADLKEPITITVLAEETSYRNPDRNGQTLLGNVSEILQRYVALGNGKITVRYIDPLINVGEVDRFKEKLGQALTTNDIVVESSRRMKRIAPQNLYTPKTNNYNGQTVTSSSGTVYYVGLRAEQRLTSTLLFVTSEQVSKAAWISDHGEGYAIAEFETLLTYANYDVMNLDLIRYEIPDDVTMLLIAAPSADYTMDEIKKISAFLERGGDMIVGMGPQGVNHPNLDLLFEEWGVKYGRDIIYDTDRNISGMFEYVLPSIQLYEGITANLPRQDAVIGGGRPIYTTDSQASSITVTPLLTSSATSYSKRYEDVGKGPAKTDADTDGPFNLGVLAERYITDKNQFVTRSSILFTNIGFFAQSVLTQQAFLNRTYIGAALNYISDYTEGLVIADKDFVSKVLTISGAQARVVMGTVVLGLPALFVLFAIIVWFRRKNL